ncbi:MAG: NUDIX hydrolase [Deltaproteobacteria bacterium]|nr:NUDIX hydrolase [Deltaproteobacteria bacterium]
MDAPGPSSAPSAVAVVVVESERFLVIRRAEGITAGGYWTPVTGRPEAGEALVATARRECLEEVGLPVEVGEEVYRCHTADGRWLLHWLQATVPAEHPREAGLPTLTLEPREVAEARWLTASEARELTPMFPATRAFYAARVIGGWSSR